MLTAVNPTNGQIIRTYKENSEQEIEEKVNAAQLAYMAWRKTTFPQRVEKLRNASRMHS